MYSGENDTFLSHKDVINMHSLVFNVMLYIIVKGSMEKFQEELFLYSESALNIVSYIKYMFIREKKGNY